MPGSDRIAVVTGASSGIGEATARGLREAGFFVVLGARREDRLMAVARELRGRGLPLDVRDLASIDAFTAAIAAEYGQVEILINNAGLAAGLQPLAQGNDDDWVQMMETNVLGLLRVTRAMLPYCDAPRARTSSTWDRWPASRCIRAAWATRRASTPSVPSQKRFASN